MYKVLITLTLGLSFVFAQPSPNINRMPCHNPTSDKSECPKALSGDPTAVNPECAKMTGANPMMCEDFTCKQDPKQMVETIRIYKITEALDLTENQSVRFFPKLKEMRDAKEEFNQTRMKMVERLDGYLQDSKKFSADIKSLIAEFEASETNLRGKEARIKKEIANILTPEQQAKFMLFQMRFNREMREMVGKAREMHRGMKDCKKDKQESHRENKRWKF